MWRPVLWWRWNNREWIYSTSETTKTKPQNKWSNGECLESGNERQWPLEKGVTLTIIPTDFVGNFPGHVTGKENPGRTKWILWVKKEELELAGQSTRKKRSSQRESLEICKGSPSSWVLINTDMLGNFLSLDKESGGHSKGSISNAQNGWEQY